MRHAMNRRNARKAHGSSMTETAPALLILFMFLFFPLVNCFAMGVQYASAYTLNDMQCREAATMDKNQATDSNGIVCKGLVDKWMHTGLGAFVQCQGTPETKVVYGNQGEVEITTKVVAKPFMMCPFFFKIPGMSAPMTFSVSNRRMIENQKFV